MRRIGRTVTPLCVDRHPEPGQAAMLRDTPVRAGQTQAPVGQVAERSPDLGAVQDPGIAVTGRPRSDPGEVRSSRGFREELHPQFLTLEHAGQVPALELLGRVLEDDGGADPERHGARVPEVRQLVAGGLLEEGALVRTGQTLSAVLDRPRDSRIAGVEQGALLGPLGLDLLPGVFVAPAQVGRDGIQRSRGAG